MSDAPDQQLNEILRLDRDGQRAAAGRRLVRLADDGMAQADTMLAAWLLTGHHWPADPAAGLVRLERGARGGDASAYACFAALHAAGLHATHDIGRALQHLTTAAMLGSHRSSMQLALLLPAGETELRARLLFEAATRGDQCAQYLLATDLLSHGSDAATRSGEQWLAIAAAAAHPRARALAAARGLHALRGEIALPPTPALPDVFWEDVYQKVATAQSSRPQTALGRDGLPDPLIVGTVQRLIPPEWCDYLIGMDADLLAPAQVNDAAAGREARHAMRSNRCAAIGLGDLDCLHALTWRRICDAAGHAISLSEWPNLLHYRSGEHYSDHVDYIDPDVPAFSGELASRGQRVMTALLYLASAEAGGRTDFPALGWSFAGQPGELLVFRNLDESGRPEPRSLHAGRAPEVGEKWVLSVWLRDRAQH
ncbi:MAG: 2OG-Fe(II) oxygenase [Steroidobacteraceae bacterium]